MLTLGKCEENRIRMWNNIVEKFAKGKVEADDYEDSSSEIALVIKDARSDVPWEMRERFTKSLEFVQKWVDESPDVTGEREFSDCGSEESVPGSSKTLQFRRNFYVKDCDGPAGNTRARKRFDTLESKEPIPVQRENCESGSNQFGEKSEIDNALLVAENGRFPDHAAENINNDPVQIGVQNVKTEVSSKGTLAIPPSESTLSDNAKANSILDILEKMIPISEASPSNALKADDTNVPELTLENEPVSSVIDFIKPLTKLNRSSEVNVDYTILEEKFGSKDGEIVEHCSNSPRAELFQKVSSETTVDKSENLLIEMQDFIEKELSALHTEPQDVQSHKSPANSLDSKNYDSGFHDNLHEKAACAKSSEKVKVQNVDKKGDSQISSSCMQELVEKTPEREGDAEQLITTVVKSLPDYNLEVKASKSIKRCLSNEFPKTNEELSNVALSPQIQVANKTDEYYTTPEKNTCKVELVSSEFSMEKIESSCESPANESLSNDTERSSLKIKCMKENNFWRDSNMIEVQEATNSNFLPFTNISEHQLDNTLQSYRKNRTLPVAHDDTLAEIEVLENSHTGVSKLCLPENSSRSKANNISNLLSDSKCSNSDMSAVDIPTYDSDILSKSSSARMRRCTYSRKEKSDPMSLVVHPINTLCRLAAENIEQLCGRNRNMLVDKNEEIMKEISLPADILKECEELSTSDYNDLSVDYSRRVLRFSSILNQKMNSSFSRNKMKRNKFQSRGADSRRRPKNISCCFEEHKCDSGTSQCVDKQNLMDNNFNRKIISSDLSSTHLNESIKSTLYSTLKNGGKESLVNKTSDKENNNFPVTPKTANAKYSLQVVNTDDCLHATFSKVEGQARIRGGIQELNDISDAASSTCSKERTEKNLSTDMGRKIDTNSEYVMAKGDGISSNECLTDIPHLKNINDESSILDAEVKPSLLETTMPKQADKTFHSIGNLLSSVSQTEDISHCQSEGKKLCIPESNDHSLGLDITSCFSENAKKKNCTLNSTASQTKIAEKGSDGRLLHPLSHNNNFCDTTFCTDNQRILKVNERPDNFSLKWSSRWLEEKNHAACRNLQPEDESRSEVGNLIKVQNLKETINSIYNSITRRKPSQHVSESELQTTDKFLEKSFESIARISPAKPLSEKNMMSNHQAGRDHEFEQDRGLNSKLNQVSLAEKLKNVDSSHEDSPRVRAELSKSVQELEHAQVEGRSFSCALGNLPKKSTSNKCDITQHNSGHVSLMESDTCCKIQPANGSELGHEKELSSSVKQVRIAEKSKTVDESFRRNPTERLEFPTNILEREYAQDRGSFTARIIEKPSMVEPSDCYRKLHNGSRSHRRKRRKPKIPFLGIDVFSMLDDYDTDEFALKNLRRSRTSLGTSEKKGETREMFVFSRHVLESELQTAEKCLEEGFSAGNTYQSIKKISPAKSLREKVVNSNHQAGRDYEIEQDRDLNSKVKQVSLAEKLKNVKISCEDSPRVGAEPSKSMQEIGHAQVEGRSFSCILGKLPKRSISNKCNVSRSDSGHVSSVESDRCLKILPAIGSEVGHGKELGSPVKQVSIAENSKIVEESFRRNPTERLKFPTNILEKEYAQDQSCFAARIIEKPSVVEPSDSYQKLHKGSNSHKRKRHKPKVPILGINVYSMLDDHDTDEFAVNNLRRSRTSLGASGKKREMFVLSRHVLESELQTAEKCLEESFPAGNTFQSIKKISPAKSLREKVVNSNHQAGRDHEIEQDRDLNSKVKQVSLTEKLKNVEISCEDSPRVGAELSKSMQEIGHAQVEGRSFSCILGNLPERSISNKCNVSRSDSGHISSVESDRCLKILPAKGSEVGNGKELGSPVKQVSIAENSKIVEESFRRNPTERLKFPTNILEKEHSQDQRSFATCIIEKPSVVEPSDSYQKLHNGSHSHKSKRRKPKVPILGIDVFSMLDDHDTDEFAVNNLARRSQTSLGTSGKRREVLVTEQNSGIELGSGENVQFKKRYGSPIEYIESKKKKKKKKVHHADESQMRGLSDRNGTSLGLLFKNDSRNSSFVTLNRHSCNGSEVNHKKLSMFS